MTEDNIRRGLLVLCWTAVIVRLPALRSQRERSVWTVLFSLGLGVTVLQNSLAASIDRMTRVPHASSLVSSLLAIGMVTSVLALAARITVASDTERVTWLRPWLLCALATMVLVVVAFAWAIVSGAHPAPGGRFFPQPGTLTALTGYWMVYGTFTVSASAWASVVFWRHLSHVQGLLKVANLMLALATTVGVCYFGTRWAALFRISHAVLACGLVASSLYFVLVALACSIAATKPLVDVGFRWWNCRRLYPLWRELCDAVPHIALHPPRPWLWDCLLVVNTADRLTDRIVEIRDGLRDACRWVTASDIQRIRDSLPLAGPAGDQPDAVTTACWLHVALDAKSAGAPPADECDDLVRVGGDDAQAERRWLRKVADAWASHEVRRCAAAVVAARPEMVTNPAPSTPVADQERI
ncbi:MAB_1171c family putative transporter [Gandjariella thermophila]|uniref:DUF6545 domain-containing protein n=1 Tax=Gandjariella thermophila TaxID=1931992 RepID=A0A4D4JHV9_9PSEU|nr:MAB_1171c family putative transporter [Gandjariella thermophila]GDY33859.1 hypothetical protein GTS_54920 [Gandjariella thermophila]